MTTTNIRRDFASRALAGIGALLMNSVYIVVDGLFVARLIGRDALAAVTVAVPVMEVLIALSMLISVGAGVLISQYNGQGEEGKARGIFNLSFWLMLAFSVGIAIIGLLVHQPLSVLAGATPELMPDVTTYMRILFAMSPFLMFSFALCTWARNDGKHKLALVAMAIGAVTNVVLDYVFIEWCGWGVGGAAFATGLGPVVSCSILLPHFLRKKGLLYLEKPSFSRSTCSRILFCGLPSFFMEFALGATTLCVNIAVSRHMGALGLAAYGVVGYVALIVLTIFLGMAEGTQPLYSYYYGKGEAASVGGLLSMSLRVCVVCGIGFYGLLLLGTKYPALLFGGQDEALVSLSVQAIGLYFPALFASGMNIQLASCLQSIGRWQRSAVVSLLRSVVLLTALLLILPNFFGNTGVWIAAPIAEVLTLPAALWLYYSLGKRGIITPAAQLQ